MPTKTPKDSVIPHLSDRSHFLTSAIFIAVSADTLCAGLLNFFISDSSKAIHAVLFFFEAFFGVPGIERRGSKISTQYGEVATGLARIKLNSWEEGVLELERQRDDFACWIRNQPNSRWALCVPYLLNGQKKGFYPDFLIVRWDNAAKSGFVVDILEPHGQQFADSLAKAKGLAEYAADEDRIGRVQIIRKVRAAGGVERFIRLDLGKGEIREKVLAARNDDDLSALFDQYGFS